MLPADLDGSTPPPAGSPAPFLMFGLNPTWPLYRFHADFGTPANSTFTTPGSLTPAAFTALCPTTRACVPQLGVVATSYLDAIADRGMFRLAHRRFADAHEALVGNLTASSNGVAGIRWFEINNATSGPPAFTQQSTYQPDTTWRWLGSAAMDRNGDLALGFSASSATINPSIRYAGRLADDTANTLAQGEASLIPGAGSQTGTGNRWGDYSDLTVDPVDDCTFWFTSEYHSTTGQFNWRTRIGNFKFSSCGPTPPPPPPPPPPPFVPPKCVVPNVVGRSLRIAKVRIVKAHCKVGTITRKTLRLAKKGRVLGEVPRAGRKLKNGAKVNLIVGKGPRR